MKLRAQVLKPVLQSAPQVKLLKPRRRVMPLTCLCHSFFPSTQTLKTGNVIVKMVIL